MTGVWRARRSVRRRRANVVAAVTQEAASRISHRDDIHAGFWTIDKLWIGGDEWSFGLGKRIDKLICRTFEPFMAAKTTRYRHAGLFRWRKPRLPARQPQLRSTPPQPTPMVRGRDGQSFRQRNPDYVYAVCDQPSRYWKANPARRGQCDGLLLDREWRRCARLCCLRRVRSSLLHDLYGATTGLLRIFSARSAWA
jgi:hypothetical protein